MTADCCTQNAEVQTFEQFLNLLQLNGELADELRSNLMRETCTAMETEA